MAVLPMRSANQSASLTAGRLQPQAQENVPVVPNNGNPGGANNMPGALAPKPAAPQFLQYSTANPSPYMQAISAMLQPAQPAVVPQPVPVAQPPMVMPERRQLTPVMPQRLVP